MFALTGRLPAITEFNQAQPNAASKQSHLQMKTNRKGGQRESAWWSEAVNLRNSKAQVLWFLRPVCGDTFFLQIDVQIGGEKRSYLGRLLSSEESQSCENTRDKAVKSGLHQRAEKRNGQLNCLEKIQLALTNAPRE